MFYKTRRYTNITRVWFVLCKSNLNCTMSISTQPDNNASASNAIVMLNNKNASGKTVESAILSFWYVFRVPFYDIVTSVM